MSKLRFYLDENVPIAVAEQLSLLDIDVVSARSQDQLGDTDINHLQRATEMGRVLCTYDQDFLRIASQNVSHARIAFALQYGATIGGWVRALRGLHAQLSAEAIVNQVKYLSLR